MGGVPTKVGTPPEKKIRSKGNGKGNLKDEERKKLLIELLDRYEERIFNLIYWKIRDYEEAKDLTQDVFIKAYKALDRFRGESSYYTWLYRIAINHTNRAMKKKSLLKFFSLDRPESRSAYYDPEPDEGEKWKEWALKAIKERIPSLPEKYREVIILYYFDGRSYEEIAEILGISMGTVKSRLSRGRDLLSLWLRGSEKVGRRSE